MYERDYISRMIRQLAEMIAAVLGLARSGKVDEALEEHGRAMNAVFGPLARTLEKVDGGSAAALLGSAEKTRAYAELALVEAELREIRGEDACARRARARARELYAALVAAYPAEATDDDRARGS